MAKKPSKIAALMRANAPEPTRRRKKVQQRGLPPGCYFRGAEVICPREMASSLGSPPKVKKSKPRRARHRRRGK